MPKAILIVQSGPSDPAREDEYNKWYDTTHVPEVCAVPGFTGAQRFALVENGIAPNDPALPPYVAIYEIDADDPQASIQEMIARVGDGRINMSDAIGMDPIPTTWLYVARD